MTADAPTRVITADDDPFARRVIKAALQAAGLTVIAEAKNGREAVQLALHYRPDVVVMDVVMPELDGILATRQILRARPDQLIVVLTGDDEHEFGLPALQAGAVGFLSKEADIEALPRALQGVLRGEAAISREMTRRLIDRYRGTADGAAGLRPIRSPLTPREWEVIELLQPDRSPETSRTRSSSPPRRCARTSRTSCASSTSTHGPTPSPPRSACGSQGNRGTEALRPGAARRRARAAAHDRRASRRGSAGSRRRRPSRAGSAEAWSPAPRR